MTERLVDLRDLDKFAASVLEADQKNIRRMMTKALRDVARPVGAAMVESGANEMPRRGGLSSRVRQGANVRATVRPGRNPSVTLSLRSRAGYDLGAMERGTIRHLTFGHAPWVPQNVPGGAFGRGLEESLPTVYGELQRGLDDLVDYIARSS